ncbi:histidine phosphatase family protein [Xenorhabdus sp. DI]|uniref:histidine phosphatase family protein n=1 Tax=Xenorhabdus doucetiae TaxID=351671 RepID=UPI0019A9244B|nr:MULTISPECIES: histidine phosphatase family protein [unclassified Xenorhabdus]MBD2784462.1 histidine phosphatase family protein [Xenorhabdus sp. 3]MBD2789278.1 histidine phosphatase family protein [Xenorhabdus sp. DI]
MRHAETSYNLMGRMLGQTDIPLCEIGLNNVRNIAPKMGDIDIGLIYSSSYIRAIQTANIISSVTRADVRKRETLKERHLGILDGKVKDSACWHDLIKRLDERDFFPEKGESVDSCLERFSEEMKNIVNSGEENVLVISHGGIISLYMQYIMKVNKNLVFLDNCAFHILENDMNGNLHVIKLNVSLI